MSNVRPDFLQRALQCTVLAALLAAGGCATTEPADEAPSPEEAVPAAAARQQENSLPPPREEIEYGHFPEDVLTRVILAEMAGQRGYNRQALQEYLVLARETGDINIIKRASRIAAYLRDVPAALEMAGMWLDREPDSQETHQSLAFQMLALGRYGQALDHLVRLLEMGHNVDFRMITARTASDDNAELFLDALIADFRELAGRYPDNHSLRLSLAHLHQQNGQPRLAFEQVEMLPETMRQAADVVQLEVQLLGLMGEDRRARQRLERALRQHPDDRDLRFHYARLLIDTQEYEAAREQFSVLVEQDPDDYDMIYSLALLNMELNRPREARRYFERLVEAGAPRLDDAHFFLGGISEQDNDVEKAIEHYMQVKGGGNYLQAQRNLTSLMVRQGRYPQARERLQRIRYTKPDYNLQLLTMEAGILLEENQLKEAGTLLDSAITAFPSNVQLLYLRSVLSQERNDLGLMEKDLRKIISIDPNSAMAYNSLGYVLADRTKRYEEAYELIRRAIELAPNDPAIIDSLGWVQYRLGMYEQALENLDRAFELYPDHEVAAHLGEVLWVMGEKEQANRIWRDALELQPDSEPIRDAIRRLKGESAQGAL